KDAYEQTGGLLKVTVVGDNPGLDTHLLYSAQGYSDTVQEVLARIRITNFGRGDAARCGIAVAVNSDDSQGINLHFRDNNQDGVPGRQFKLLDDRRAWGPRGYDLDWENNTWYWLRLRQTGPDAPANLNGKVWLADGTVPEPDQWQLNWGRDGRVGLAGIVGSSIDGISDFEVDYILIKADGLPSTKVAPSAFGFGPFINITQQPSDAVVPPGQNVTLTVAATGSSATTFQWQRANAGSSNFTDVSGATAATLTIPSPSEADNGVKYRAMVSVPGLNKPSREAVIITDVTPPTLVSARTLGDPNKVTVVFSEALAAIGAEASFSIDNGITVSGMAAGPTANVIELTTSSIVLGNAYNLTVSGVKDLFNNVILPDSKIPINLFVELPLDFGQTVNGFQDDFTGAVRDPNWVANGPAGDLYAQAGGVLTVTATVSDPNHLLYMAPGYSGSAQEVLARIRIKTFGAGDYPRGGIGVGVNGDTGQGIEMHFRNSDFGQDGTRFRLLDDLRAWGPAIETKWTFNTWFWVRLRQTGSTTEAGPNISAKAWLGDGTAAEPAEWQATWGRAERTGFAGITGSSTTGAEGIEEFEVDYILIKADGLPSTKVASTSFSLVGPAPTELEFTAVTKTTGGQILLEWIGAGTLEQADSATGPWTVVTPAASPFTITVSGPAKFYRLRQ
ncbi:MAG: immunoglobulin domain-containing protein, partial [Verrucomicrobiales bacterium]|nr:immunoglobulin domain-containing protein [Verrucomicrobiales bacterium]